MLNIEVLKWSLAAWRAFTFVFCVVYGQLTPSSVNMSKFLELVLPGSGWLSGGASLWASSRVSSMACTRVSSTRPATNLHRRWVRQ